MAEFLLLLSVNCEILYYNDLSRLLDPGGHTVLSCDKAHNKKNACRFLLLSWDITYSTQS